MSSRWTRSNRTSIALVLLVSVGALLGLATLSHSHDDGSYSASHCEACRWASDAIPLLAVLLVLLLTLPESGPAQRLVPAFWSQASRRRLRSRGPPLV